MSCKSLKKLEVRRKAVRGGSTREEGRKGGREEKNIFTIQSRDEFCTCRNISELHPT
jgi:hypothetical protein